MVLWDTIPKKIMQFRVNYIVEKDVCFALLQKGFPLFCFVIVVL